MRPYLLFVTLLIVLMLLIPSIVVQFLPTGVGQVREKEVPLQTNTNHAEGNLPEIQISVYRTTKKEIEKVSLEEYIRGVVASEMPAEFELEALKAQAMAARTYIIRRLVEKDFSDTPEGAHVTDNQKHQVYHNEAELKELWGREYDLKLSKVNQAINETMGKVITYQGKPIDATFFSTSNGFTENSEEYWSKEIPYLRSVASPWDKASPRYEEELSFTWKEFQDKLGVKIALPASTAQQPGEIISRTKGNRVKEVKVGENSFSGKEIRELLNLPSSDFRWKIENGKVIVYSLGWGHGVGLSQWGANGMAEEGYKAEEIVNYYYQNVQIQDYRQWLVSKAPLTS